MIGRKTTKPKAKTISLAGARRARKVQQAGRMLGAYKNRIVWLVLIATVAGLAYRFSGTTSAPPGDGTTIESRVARVVDGDSLYLLSHRPQIRLWGVDAPERREAGFQAATDHLTKIALGQDLKCYKIVTDKYRRTVARCYLADGREINRMMIDSGTATEYFRFTKGYYQRTKP